MRQSLAATLRQQLAKRQRASEKLSREMATIQDALRTLDRRELAARASQHRARRRKGAK